MNFGDDPDHRPDQGVRSPKSGFTGSSKKYVVDSDQSYIANLHCKNHSAILLCWRSAKVCASTSSFSYATSAINYTDSAIAKCNSHFMFMCCSMNVTSSIIISAK